MDIEKNWEKALRNTEIIRSRIRALLTYQATPVPYILLSESSINLGDTLVRQGEVLIDKPSLFVPPNNPLFSGFEFDDSSNEVNENSLMNFLLLRGVSIPSLHYNNSTKFLDIYEGKLSEAIKHYGNLLQRQENIATGLVVGPEDCWQFSLLIFICSQVARNADSDIKRLLDDYRRGKNDHKD